jgi:hypothetical protein
LVTYLELWGLWGSGWCLPCPKRQLLLCGNLDPVYTAPLVSAEKNCNSRFLMWIPLDF